jgi:hypothetical protein
VAVALVLQRLDALLAPSMIRTMQTGPTGLDKSDRHRIEYRQAKELLNPT